MKVAILCTLLCAAAAAAAEEYEVRGEVMPHARSAVTLHAVASPFATTTLTGPDGRFRFRNIDPGAYTISAFVPDRGETRMTIEVGAGTADKRHRVEVRIDTHGDALNRDAGSMVSARELKVPDRARRELEDAERKISRRDYAGAIVSLERAVEIAPQFANAWNQLGTIAYQTKRYEDAENYFRKGIEADPEAYSPLVNLGGVLINLGNLDEAWKYNVAAVLRRPNDALAQAQLGMTYLALDKLDLAEKHLLEARRLDPGHFSHPQLHLAEVYARKNDRARAAEQLEDFLKHHPDWPTASKMREAITKWRRP